MSEEFIEVEEKLLDYLLKKFNKLSRNSVKNLLTSKKIVINNKVVTKYDYLLKKGDKISFQGKKSNCSLKIIYEDDLFLVIDKPYNLLTILNKTIRMKRFLFFIGWIKIHLVF